MRFLIHDYEERTVLWIEMPYLRAGCKCNEIICIDDAVFLSFTHPHYWNAWNFDSCRKSRNFIEKL